MSRIQNEERTRLQKYNQRFNRAKLAVEPKHKIWAEIDKFDRGEQWKGTSLPPWIPTPVSNWLRYARTLKRANLAANIPRAHFTAKQPENREFVEKLERAYEHVWQTEKVPRVIRRCVDRAIAQGTAIAFVYNDNEYVGGPYYGEGDPRNKLYRGRIVIKRIPIANFFPDPDATCLEDMKYFEITESTTLRAIKNNPNFQRYAREKGRIRKFKALDYSMFSGDDHESGEIYDRDSKIAENGQNVLGDEMVLLHTHWERYLNDEGEWQLDVTWYVPQIDFELYRIEDYKPSVYPIAILYDEEEEGEFWGTSTLMEILENQKLLNKADQTAAIISTLHQNPQKVVLRESGINAQELARTGTLPGKVWTSNVDPRVAVANIETPDIPKGLFELKADLKQDMRERLGINEAYTGDSIGSLTTSTGVHSLIERATIRDKDKMIQIDEFVEKLSDLIALNILYHWRDPRPITIIGPDGEPIYETFEPFDEITINNLDWIIKSDVYAKAPTTQALRREQADRLIQLQGQFNFNPPIITAEEWIQFQDFDMKEEILRRIEQDRNQLEREKALSMAENMVQLANTIRQFIAQGMPEQEALAAAQQAAEEMLAQQKQQEMLSSRPRDVEKEAQAPQGITGQLAMASMARGM